MKLSLAGGAIAVLLLIAAIVGYNALFFLAGLQSIPEYLNEAAMLMAPRPGSASGELRFPYWRQRLCLSS